MIAVRTQTSTRAVPHSCDTLACRFSFLDNTPKHLLKANYARRQWKYFLSMKSFDSSDDDDDDNAATNTNKDDDHLSEHTRSMRRALEFCCQAVASLSERDDDWLSVAAGNTDVCQDARTAARSLPHHRQQARLERQQGRMREPSGRNMMDVLEGWDDDVSPETFQRRFTHGNVPCLIRNATSPYFEKVQSLWTIRTNSKVSDGNREKITNNDMGTSTEANQRRTICRQWFFDHVGASTRVPVRYTPTTASISTNDKTIHKEESHSSSSSSAAALLDADGRASECETREMTFSEWLELVDDGEDNSDQSSSLFYLKDWHLQAWLIKACRSKRTPQDYDPLVLYNPIPFFEVDLLNAFLTQFTEGDYRFCYWGPRGSFTNWHSDVLNSFSWSYNVCGRKRWTFQVPDSSNDPPGESTARKESSAVTLVLEQNTGECVFVPAGWKHQVINLEETISINHNWITTANLDLVWECLCSEIEAIDAELDKWNGVVRINSEEKDWQAHESMLRGCAGLDATAFCLMILYGIIIRMQHWQNLVQQNSATREDNESIWMVQFDLVRLVDMLQQLVHDEKLHIKKRVSATLQDKALGAIAVQLWTHVLERFQVLMPEEF